MLKKALACWDQKVKIRASWVSIEIFLLQIEIKLIHSQGFKANPIKSCKISQL